MKPPTAIAKICLIVIFLLSIFSPLIIFLLQDDKDVSAAEKRKLAARPELSVQLDSLLLFPEKFEKYYNDHFGLRDLFILWYAWGKNQIGDSLGGDQGPGAAITGNVIKGKDGWFYLNRVWDGDPLSDYRNIDLYSPVQLRRAVIKIAARKHWLEKQGIQYLLVIAPNKHTIYSEYLPAYIIKQGDKSSMDQLYEALEKYTSVQFVDLRDALLRAKATAHLYWLEDKQNARLYWKTDSHWNGAGVDIAQYEIARSLEKMFPGQVEPAHRPGRDFKLQETTGDLAILMNNKSLKEKGPVVTSDFCSQKTLKIFKKKKQRAFCKNGKVNAIIFHDSFIYLDLKRYLADYFKTTLFIWKNFNQKTLQKYIPIIKPAVIIEQFAERFLPYHPDIDGESYNDFFGRLFDRSSRTVFTMNWKGVSEGTSGYTNQNLKVQSGQRDFVLRLQALTDDPQMYLPEISFKPGSFYVLKVVITAPADTVLQVFYSRRGAENLFPSPSDYEQLQIKKGANTLYVPLLSGRLGSRIRFDPGKIKGQYSIDMFAMREIGPELIQ